VFKILFNRQESFYSLSLLTLLTFSFQFIYDYIRENFFINQKFTNRIEFGRKINQRLNYKNNNFEKTMSILS